jgi:hypothetical protein
LLVAVAVAVAAAQAGAPGPAHADQFGAGGVDCEQFPNHPECQVNAVVPNQPDAPIMSPSGEVTCRWAGEEVPCRDDWGWYGGDGCYYRELQDGPSQRDGVPGAAYQPRCLDDPSNALRPAVWIPDDEAPGPAALGRTAVSRLVLPQPQIELSPPLPAPQLVMLPTWFWVVPQWWESRSASASVPGVTVTAVARPTEVRWSTGDGAEIICDEGTPYEPGGDPAAASPDCGHTYTHSSAGQPGGAYTLTATVTWRVSWSGGGMSGQVGPLFSTASAVVEVLESRSVNTDGRPLSRNTGVGS